MKDVRYLTFEVNDTCNMDVIHPKCPINDPERYRFGSVDRDLTDDVIVQFWSWADVMGFRGIVLWHLYNEPTLALPRIEALMARIKRLAPEQRFHLWTNSHQAVKLVGFNHVQLTNYHDVRPDDLDNRRASTRGEGRSYDAMPSSGFCGRGYGWEVIIDHHGNWLLCCNDWRCEESVGNILDNPAWRDLFDAYKLKADVRWTNKESYERLPRMCRSCMDVNPNLHRSALPVADSRTVT